MNMCKVFLKLVFIAFYILLLVLNKVLIFWEGHKILRNIHLLLTTVHTVKSKVKISQNFVAFSEYMNFITINEIRQVFSPICFTNFFHNTYIIQFSNFSCMFLNPNIFFSNLNYDCSKVHIFWEGHKILRNLPLTFDYSTYSQK